MLVKSSLAGLVLCLVATCAQAAPAGRTSATAMPAQASGTVCSWGNGAYSNGSRMCVSVTRVLVCINGEWRVDETRTSFTEDVCRQNNPRAPTFGK
ncbi:MAG: hypothetical protein ACJ8EL_19795 [Rhizomicrobium sp.]